MARPRTVSDAQIFAALARAIGRAGPVRLTLADVAKEAGVSAAAVVQRFGSKRELLLAFLRGTGEGPTFTDRMRRVYEQAADPVDGLIDAVVAVSGQELSPEEFANHLAFLHFELADPEFRAQLAVHDEAVRNELAHYVNEATDKGLLTGHDEHKLADAVNSLLSGTQISWAMSRNGTLADAMRRDLETLLTPYRTK